MRLFLTAVTIFATLLGAPALAQDWTLDSSLRGLEARERQALISALKAAPRKALQDLLRTETRDLRALTRDERERYARNAWSRLTDGSTERGLALRIAGELRQAGVFSARLLDRVLTRELPRLRSFPQEVVVRLVETSIKAVLVDRLRAIHDARVEVASAGRDGMAGRERFRSERRSGARDTSLAGFRYWPKVTFFAREAKLREVLYERTFKSKLGKLRVTAAEVDGLARVNAGRVTYVDAFGNTITGLGADFTARARLTVASAAFDSKRVRGIVTKDLGVRAHLTARATTTSNLEASAAAVVNERGVGVRASVSGGAIARATVRVPITLDLKVVTLRVVPYLSASAGVSGEARFALEVEWAGKLRLDVGASLATAGGAGAGLLVEIELGPALKRALRRLITEITTLMRPASDAILGRRWRGPAAESERLRLGLDDLERRWAETGDAPGAVDLANADPRAIAARYAPVFYQRVRRGLFDMLRCVDFDGDWDTRNNWEHTSNQADSSAWVYYDVRETRSHYYVTYVVYHSGRYGSVLPTALDLWRSENDLGGCIVVARKGAAPGREIEALITCDGSRSDLYSGIEPVGGEPRRWSRRYGSWHGSVQFVDEVDHPLFDVERTHPQVWIDGGDHGVHGFNGRDDAHPFDGDDGIVYVPARVPDRPEALRDMSCGYALRPLSELRDRAFDPLTVTTDRLPRVRDGHVRLPARLRGDEGLDDRAVLPWAWRLRPHDKESVREGEVFMDPARTLALLFQLPDDVSRVWVDNPYLVGGEPKSHAPESARDGLIHGLR